MTYDDLMDLCRNGDPLITVEDTVEVTDEGLVIMRSEPDPASWSLDVRIKILEDGQFRVWIRDNEHEKDGMWGREWTNDITLSSYEKVVTWIYGF